MNLQFHLARQIAFSRNTFGPGERTTSISEVLGVSSKTAGEWIDEVEAIIREKIGDKND